MWDNLSEDITEYEKMLGAKSFARVVRADVAELKLIWLFCGYRERRMCARRPMGISQRWRPKL